ncbi:MAG: MFS family permease [Candidatus Promineifilaceae bacterium]|jgi:MFS family permease
MTSQSPIGYIQLLRQNRNFRWLWGGQVVSLLGDWFNLIASAALLAQLTNSGLAIGGLFVVRMLAPFLVAPFAGVVADRYNRKRILIATDIIRGITVLGFLFVRRPEDVWLLYTLTAIQLGVGGFFFPTRNAILPDIVKPEEIGTANTISSVTWSTMLTIGAALGGLVAGFWGITPAFVIDALTFAVSALLLSQVRYAAPEEVVGSDKSVAGALTQYLDGLRYLRQRLDQLMIVLLKGGNSLLISAGFQIIQVKLSESIYTIGEGGGISLGLFFGMAGIGTGVGPIIARRITGDEDRPMRWGIAIAWIISGAGMWIVSTLGSFPLVLFGTFLRGFGGGIIWVFSTQLLLQSVDGEVRGRIFATEYMIFTLLSAAGAAAVGWALDGSLEITTVMRIMGSLVFVPAILWTLWILFQDPKGSSNL